MCFRILACVSSLYLVFSCEKDEQAFQIGNDFVREGEYLTRFSSTTTAVSNYPGQTDNYEQPILYKLSINGHDNEGGFGQDHFLVIPEGIHEFYTPRLKFGEHMPRPPGIPQPLSGKVNVHFRVDMRDILSDFGAEGFTVTPTGDTIRAEEFRGLYIAGSTPPLTWNWGQEALDPNLTFADQDGDSIFELTVTFEPPGASGSERSWQLTQDISGLPEFHAPQAPLLEGLYNMALEEALLNIQSDSTFAAGAEWPGVWTRDVSYAGHLALSYFFPEIMQNSLRAKVSANGRIVQDTGTGGSWPVSSDRLVWILAAWETYLATGDQDWLAEISPVVIRALQEDMLWNRDAYSGLLRGETSFEDWREQTYPIWLNPAGIHASFALSTNILFLRALEIGAFLAPASSQPAHEWPFFSEQLETTILGQFWNQRNSHLSSYILQAPAWLRSEHRDALGEALAVLFTSQKGLDWRAELNSYGRSIYGTPVISPQLPHAPPYHNQGIWPFVEAYSLWAAKEAGATEAYRHSARGLTRAAALFLTHKENFHWQTGNPVGMAINSDRQLWSVAAYLSSILRGLFGVELVYDLGQEDITLRLHPSNPWEWDDFQLAGLRLRDARVNLALHGRGDSLAGLVVNGIDWQPDRSIPLLKGTELEIVMTVRERTSDAADTLSIITGEDFLPAEPVVAWQMDTLHWESTTSSVLILHNSYPLDTLVESPYVIPDTVSGFFSIQSIDALDRRSIQTEPHYLGPMATLVLNRENPYYVDLGEGNSYITMSFQLPDNGQFLVRFRYANGEGPISTDNKCGLGMLKINDWWFEQLISFPQTGSWDNWQNSAWYPAEFKAGDNELILDLESLMVHNMNEDTNHYRVSTLEIIPERSE